MSKILCDVCGTSFPETATQCPICGCVRSSDVTVIAGNTNEAEQADLSTYTYVKGGRFSRSNVKRRSRSQQGSKEASADIPAEGKEEKGQKDIGLIVAVCVLLLAIVSVVIYIAMHFFSSGQKPADDYGNVVNTDDYSSVETTEIKNLEVPCVDILVSKTVVELNSVDAACLLNVTTNPADTTDKVQFTSADDLIATVSEVGKIVAVGTGETIITITCGNAKAECRVICNIETPDAEVVPDETVAVETPEEAGAYKISHTDVTLRLNGEPHQKTFRLTLKDSDGNVKDVKWIVGDPTVCEVSGNTVTAINTGYTKVKVTVDGVTYVCIVRVV